jgi:hypothetical protein
MQHRYSTRSMQSFGEESWRFNRLNPPISLSCASQTKIYQPLQVRAVPDRLKLAPMLASFGSNRMTMAR